MAKAWPIPGLEAGTRFGDAAAAAIDTRTREVFAHAAGVLDPGHPERVHDMRVATRRLRAALEVFAPCLPAKRHRRLLKAVKRLADALGERRDPDVAIARLERLRDSYDGAEAAAIDEVLAAERERQVAGNDRLAAALATARAEELERRLLELAAEVRG